MQQRHLAHPGLTMRIVVLDAASLGDDISLAALTACSNEVVLHDFTPPELIIPRLEGAQIVVVNKTLIDARVINACPQLRLVAITATGTNNVDLAVAQQRGVRVCNVIRYGRASLVQHTFMLILTLAGNLNRYQQDVKARHWDCACQFCLMDHRIVELEGKTLGIVGHGDLGQGVALMATAFGMKVLVAQRPGAAPAEGRIALPDLLPQVDILSLHCLLSDETRQMIGRQQLALMQPHAFLINTARGGLVDEQALADALVAGRLAGAGLDVLSEEPPVNGNVLLDLDLPQLIITPHCAWASREARQRLVDMTADNIRQFIAGSQRRFVV